MPNTPRSNVGVVVAAAAAVVITVTVAVTFIAVLVEDGPRALSLIAPIVGLVPVVIAFLTLVAKVDNIGTKVEAASSTVAELANGGGDRKLREVIYQVLRDDLVDPQAKAQVEADRRAAAAREAAARVLEERA